MPPANPPITLQVQDALVAQLETIVEGPNYYSTVKTVSRKARFDANMEMPAITMLTLDDDENDAITNGYITGSLRAVLGLHLVDLEDPETAVENFLADAKRCVREDHELGGVSIDTHALTSRRWLVPTETGRAGATLEILIDYRYRTADPSQVQ